MKKIFAIIIAASLLLTACGKETNEKQNSSENENISTGSSSSSTSQSEKSKKSFVKFNAKSLTGEEITEEIFSDYDITMINIWATWCGPCVNEIPELGELNNKLPENYNLITICTDGKGQEEEVKSFLENKGVNISVLIPDENIENFLKKHVNAYPTSLFVDKEGNIIGKMIQGAPRENIADTYLNIMNERAEILN